MSNSSSGQILGAATGIGGLTLLPHTAGQGWLSILPYALLVTSAVTLTVVLGVRVYKYAVINLAPRFQQFKSIE